MRRIALGLVVAAASAANVCAEPRLTRFVQSGESVTQAPPVSDDDEPRREQRVQPPRQQQPDDDFPPQDDDFPSPRADGEDEPQPEQPPAEESRKSSGTGFFITADGFVMTNAHVVEGCSALTITGAKGARQVRLVAKDATNDLAVLKSDVQPKRVVRFRSDVRLGEAVEAFGYPLAGVLSTSGNFTLGNITALSGLSDDNRYYQISAPVQPGNSGGPLLDAYGNFIGVVSSKLNAVKMMEATNGDIAQNVNFAIKASVAATFLEKNGITFERNASSEQLQPADIADLAKELSVHINCN